jgi:hypothetical protein
MRWRSIVLVVLLPLWLGGCWTTKRSQMPASGRESRQLDTGGRSDDLPTPQLFDFRLDLSHP